MDIRLVITNTKRKSLVFVDQTLKTFSLSEMINAVKDGVFENMYLVTGTSGTYIRSMPDKTPKNNIDTLSVTGAKLIAMAQGFIPLAPFVATYITTYLASLKEGAPFIKPIGSFRIPSVVVKRVFQSHAPVITQAAKEFDIDRYTLGAIIIDEIARLYPFEPIYEKLKGDVVGKWVSVGVAQVSIDTANDLIRAGLYNPNPSDKKLPFSGTLTNQDRRHLYNYVVEPKHNIRFAATNLRFIIDTWIPSVDLSSRPEILGVLYSQGVGVPHAQPKSNERSEQIAHEFYQLASTWLKNT